MCLHELLLAFSWAVTELVSRYVDASSRCACFAVYSARVRDLLDKPPLRSISGRVVRGDTGAPIAAAWVTFYSRRKPFSPI